MNVYAIDRVGRDSTSVTEGLFVRFTPTAASEEFDLSRQPNTSTLEVFYATGVAAQNKLCSDNVFNDVGLDDVLADAVAGLITSRAVFDSECGKPTDVRIMARDLVFENGLELAEIEFDWLKIGSQAGDDLNKYPDDPNSPRPVYPRC